MSPLGSGLLNTFGQILQAGGEKALAIGKAIGWGASRVSDFIFNRLKADNDFTAQAIDQFTNEMVGAGKYLGTLQKGANVDLGQIPLNPYLFGDDPAGGRLWVPTHLGDTEQGPFVRTDFIFGDLANLDELFGEVSDWVNENRQVYDRIRHLLQHDDPRELYVRVLAAERRF